MKNLLECDGRLFTCKIKGTEVSGRITVEEGEVYLCQNEREGNDCENKRGYKYSWTVDDGHPDRLSFNKVTDFRLCPLTRSEVDSYKDWQVGDKVTNLAYNWEVIFRCGELVVCKDVDGKAAGPFTCDELYDMSFRLVFEDMEDSAPVEVALEEIAAWKGVSVDQLKIVG